MPLTAYKIWLLEVSHNGTLIRRQVFDGKTPAEDSFREKQRYALAGDQTFRWEISEPMPGSAAERVNARLWEIK